MVGNSLGRRSSTNPVRISAFDREEKNVTRTDAKRSLVSKSKVSISGIDNSHIPRPRMRTSSCDRASIRGLTLKNTGKTPLRHAPTTPRTPVSNVSKPAVVANIAGASRNTLGLPTGRRSLSADRASSLGGKGFRKDTRPIADKTYQAFMLNKIDNFFSVNNCSSMLNNNGSLKPITLKMFVEVSAFVVKLLDIKQILTITNYVEELPKIAKRLHYPGVITKSWLKTANAMHSWPNVLAWICWLVEICEVREIAFEEYNLEGLPFMGNPKQAKISRHTFFSMFNFYKAWNDEKLEEEAEMVEKYLQELEKQEGVKKEDLDHARSELEEERIKLQTLEENANKVDEEVKHLQEVLKNLQEDEEKQLNYHAAKEVYIKKINSETEHINGECDALAKQIRLLDAQRVELDSLIKQQPMSMVERDEIVHKCADIQNYIREFDEHLQSIKKEVYTTDLKLASVNKNITKSVLTYNKEILMHLSDRIEVDLEKLKMPEKGLSHPDLMEILNAKADLMNELKVKLKGQIVEKERSIACSSNQLEILQEKMKKLEDESNDVANEITEKKNLRSRIKNDARNEETKLKEQIKTLQNDIKEIEGLVPNLQLAQELEEAADKLDAVGRRKAYMEESARLFFNQFYKILGEHRSELHSILEKHRNL